MLARVLLVALVPGVAASLVLHRPGRVPLALRLALVPALGCAVAGGAAFLLAVGHVLSAASFLAVVAVAAGAGLVVASRRDGLRAHGRALRDQLREDRWSLGLGLVVLAGIAILRLAWPAELHFGSPTAWRYWADATEIADAGRVPPFSLQYGGLLAPTTSKVLLNSLNAGFAYAAGAGAVRAMGAVLWLGAAGLAATLWGLGRELGLRFTAPLLPLLLVANRRWLNTELTADLDTFKAEILGRMLAFAGLALAVHAVRRSGRSDAVVAGALLGTGAVMHVVPVLVAAALFGGVVLVVIARESGRGEVLLRAALSGVTALGVAVVILLASGGDLGLGGVSGDDAYRRFGFDPTLYVNAGVGPDRQVRTPGRWRIPPGEALDRYAASATRLGGDDGPPAALPVGLALGGLAAAVAMAVWFPRELRPLGAAAWVLLAAIVALTVFFSYRSELYIPAYFGVRRLFDYSALPLVLLAFGLAEGGAGLLARARPWAPAAAVAALVAVLALLLVPSARPSPGRVEGVTRVTGTLDWISEHTPCDARFVANVQTEGIFEAYLGRVHVLEGMTPYLRPEVLEPVVRRFLDARAFFRDPAGREGFVRDLGADYVVVFRGGGVGYPAMIGGVNADLLDAAAFLELVHADDVARVYRVRGEVREDGFPDPEGFPGYRCRTAA